MDDEDRFWVGPADSPDSYQLISPLGNGAEGQVWRAVVHLSGSGRSFVAVKILPPIESGSDPSAWDRYSHLLRSLDHPGLVRLVDVFLGPRMHRRGTVASTEVEGPVGYSAPPHRYVVMRLIGGVTFREWLDEHLDSSIPTRLRLLSAVAAALDEMHSGRQTGVPVAHGDVKPGNIVIRDDGSSVLVDLGLTRIADDQGRTGRSRPYAAPELFAPGAMTTPEADRFAFYATTVHAVLGDTPPTVRDGGPDPTAIAARLQSDQSTARRPLLIQALLYALQAPPAERPPRLSHWLASLTETLSQTTQAVPTGTSAQPSTIPPPARRRGRLGLTLVAGAAVVALVAGIVGYQWLLSGGQNPQSQGTMGPSTGVRTTTPAVTASATAASTSAAPSTTTGPPAAPPAGGSYSAPQPGPGCDSGGAVWVPKGFGSIDCGTKLTVGAVNSRSFLYFQLPSGQPLARDFTIGITVSETYEDSCTGLATVDATRGYLVDYCTDGRWHVYSISGGGAIKGTLATGLSARTRSLSLSLTIQGSALSFVLGDEKHIVQPVTTFAPTQHAIVYMADDKLWTVHVSDFSYTPTAIA